MSGNHKLKIAAICYDFDCTLSPMNMQEYGLFDALKVDAPSFWRRAEGLVYQYEMDKTLAYMYLLVKECQQKNISINAADLHKQGKNITFFEGVLGWFDRMNAYATEHGILLEHYIISAGIREVIDGTPIAKHFKKIYASRFLFDAATQEPVWARQVVNATNKTQFLFRINKGTISETDDALNEPLPTEHRRIPFSNMIYIGDSLGDVPCMRLTKQHGGLSVAVYHPSGENQADALALLEANRVHHATPANYTAGSPLDTIVKDALAQI